MKKPEEDGLLQNILDRLDALEEQLAILKAPTPVHPCTIDTKEELDYASIEEYNQHFKELFFGEKK